MIVFYHSFTLIGYLFFELPVNLSERCALKQPNIAPWMYRGYINAN